MVLFVLLCLFTYDLTSRKKVAIEKSLQAKLDVLKESVLHAKNEQLLLDEQIVAQNDPSWIELTLMRKLGLVPENQKIVFFKELDLDIK